MHRLIAFPRAVVAFLMRCGVFLVRRSVVLALGACLGYAYGYDHARVGQPSLYSRAQASAQSLIGWDRVRDDHENRQRAIEAFRQARADSIQALLPH